MSLLINPFAFGAGTPPFDPLSISWTHAYWTEGAEFEALGYTNGATINPWPDEVSTADLAQGTAGNRPTLVTAEATFNNKDVVRFDGSNDYMSVDWADLSQPNEYVFVAKLRSTSLSNQVLCDGLSSGRQQIERVGGAAPSTWQLFAGATLTGGSADTNLHLWRAIFNGGSSALYHDETLEMSGNAGTGAAPGMYLCARSTIPDRFGIYDIAFCGVKNGALTAGERSDLHAWAQSHYGSP